MPEPGEKNRGSWARQLAHYSHIGFALPAATLVGWLLGAWLDSRLGTDWIYLLGLLLGVAAGFVELVRTLMQASRE